MPRLVSVINNPVFGGGMNLLVALREPLAERGWDTRALVPDLPEAAPGVERMRAGGLPTDTVRLHRVRRTADPRTHARLLATLPGEIASLRRIIRSENVDVVQAFGDTNPHAAFAARLEGVAVVWQLYDTVTPPPLRRLTMPVVTRVADVVITWGRALAAANPGVEDLGERCVVVYPPVDPDRFRADPERRAAARAELGVPQDALLVGTVGVRNPTKGHDVLAEAIAEVRAAGCDAWCRVLGAPSPVHAEEMAQVDARVAELGLGERMTFVDPGTRVPELMPAFDVMVISSVPRSEGVPTVILEAMSCELPVVTTDVGAAAEVVETGVTGTVVPPLQPAALAAALRELLEDTDLRRRFGAAGRERVLERHRLEHTADTYQRAFELALRHREARGRR